MLTHHLLGSREHRDVNTSFVRLQRAQIS